MRISDWSSDVCSSDLLVRDAAHDPVERVDLAHQMPLAEAADRRIAGHLADGVEAVGHEQGARAQPRRRGRGFAAGMPAADDNDVPYLRHGADFLRGTGPSQDRSFPELLDRKSTRLNSSH